MNVPNKSISLLFNPSVYIAGGQALGIGIGTILLTGLIGAVSNTHFDGVLDMHTGMSAPIWVFLAEGIIDWLCLALVLLGLGRLVSKTSFRTIDLFGTQAFARWPTALSALLVLPPAFQRVASSFMPALTSGVMPKINGPDGIVFALVVLAMLALFVWMVGLMYKSFSVSCNVKGGKAAGTFFAGIMAAEIISKVCLVAMLKCAVANGSAGTFNFSQSGVPEELKSSATNFVDLLAKKDFATAESKFNAVMKSALPEDKLRAVWEDATAKEGPLQKQLGVRTGKLDGYNVVYVGCQFQKEPIDMKMVYDSDRMVTGLFFVTPGSR